MLQTINMLELRKKVGQVIDETLYRKDRFLIKRKNKPVAVLLPIEDYELFIGEYKDIELYTKKRIKEFEKQDRLSTQEQNTAQRLQLISKPRVLDSRTSKVLNSDE